MDGKSKGWALPIGLKHLFEFLKISFIKWNAIFLNFRTFFHKVLTWEFLFHRLNFTLIGRQIQKLFNFFRNFVRGFCSICNTLNPTVPSFRKYLNFWFNGSCPYLRAWCIKYAIHRSPSSVMIKLVIMVA